MADIADACFCRKTGCRKSFHTINGQNKHQTKCKKPMREKAEKYTKTECGKITCNTCQENFSYVQNYYQHAQLTCKKINKKIKEKKVHKCVVCSKEFAMKAHLIRRIETHTKRTFICSICDITYTRSDHCGKHIKNVYLLIQLMLN